MINSQFIFIVGSSRSGTTMMGRVLSNNSNIFTFKELHFFNILSKSNFYNKLSVHESTVLLAKLLCVQDNSIFEVNSYKNYIYLASDILPNKLFSSFGIFDFFINYILKKNNKTIACLQTPNNIHFTYDINKYFPNALFINMVRDPRDVLLSQKNKWKRRFLGSSKIPFYEAFRSYANYHPIITSKILVASLKQTLLFKGNPNFKIVLFEKFLNNSELMLKEICSFLSIEYNKKMLLVPLVGSSTENDLNSRLFLDKSKIFKWKKGGLNSSEIFLSQLISKEFLMKFNYQTIKFKSFPLFLIFYFLTLPIKLSLSLILNLHRTFNVFKYFKKLLFTI
tara:strand:+ start:88146 stop:89156 length:1011 start_codon:yes stop_codon:yes gene_type:complete